MKPALIVLNPRQIEPAMAAFNALEIDKVWVTGMTECEIAARWGEVLDATDATHLLVASDDLVPTQQALDDVLVDLADHPAVTGYCNLALDDDRVNLCKRPLPDERPKAESYSFLTRRQVERSRSRLVRTFFAGMCFTGMSREMWQRFPFGCFGPIGGFASDYHLSVRLTTARVPIVCPKSAWSHHLKPTFEFVSPTLVGRIPPEIRTDSPIAAPASQE